jgi:hypothetical protein
MESRSIMDQVTNVGRQQPTFMVTPTSTAPQELSRAAEKMMVIPQTPERPF